MPIFSPLYSLYRYPPAVPKEDLKILEFPGPTQMANIGERLVLRCEATAGYQFAYLQWSRSRDMYNFTYLPIYEDPLCDSRVTNVSLSPKL